MSETLRFLLFLSFLLAPGAADNCTDCTETGKVWCVENSECYKTVFEKCQTHILVPLNCPSFPSPQYAYDDEFMRTQQMVISTAAQNENPQLCFDNQLPSMKLYQIRTVNCTDMFSDVTCVGYTAYDIKQKVIVIAFKGAHGKDQLEQMGEEIAKFGLQSYFNGNGKIFKVVYDSFMLLWNSGMFQDLKQLKYKYPNYELWVNGHSLGAMLTWTASSYIATTGLYKPEQMKVVAMGAGRIGDYRFAEWHSATFPYSYHIVHRKDFATRQPMIDPHSGSILYHPRTEVWYNNYMKVGDPYEICPEADGDYCSNTVEKGLLGEDHLYYFNIDLPAWGHAGCPKNISAYAQN